MAKQNGVQIVVVLLAFTLVHREWRRAAIVALVPSALLLAAVVAGPAWFGEHYYENVVGGLNNGVRPYAAFTITYIPIFLHYNAAALAGLMAYIASGWFGPAASRQQRFLAIALGVTFVLAALSATKLGSAPHYYDDFLTLLAFGLALWLDSVCRERPERSNRVLWAVAVFAVLFFSNQAVALRENFDTRPWQPLSVYDGIVAHMREELREHRGNQFFTVDYTFANFFPGRAVVPQYSLSGIMHARGLVDYAKAQSMMDSGEVRWLLVGAQQDIARQLGFIGLNPTGYVRTAEVDGFAIWTHAPAQEQATGQTQ